MVVSTRNGENTARRFEENPNPTPLSRVILLPPLTMTRRCVIQLIHTYSLWQWPL